MSDAIHFKISAAERKLLLETLSLPPELRRPISVAVCRGKHYEIALTPEQMEEMANLLDEAADREDNDRAADRLLKLCDVFDGILNEYHESFAPAVENIGKNTGKVVIVRVSMEGSSDTWRRIAIREGQSLHDLHVAIFKAFDRFEDHLYSFYLSNASTSQYRKRSEGPEYTHPYTLEDGGPMFSDEVESAAGVRIGELKLKPKQKITYLFDFGDSWWHDIQVEQIGLPAEKGDYPRILEKHGDSPPQYPEFEDDEGDFLDDDDFVDEEER
jgi:hypothetical protein